MGVKGCVNQRYCSFFAEKHNNKRCEVEEHVLFHYPEYDICRPECPELFLVTNMNMKNISDYDNQETIAQLLWNITMIRIKLGVLWPYQIGPSQRRRGHNWRPFTMAA